MLLIIITPRKSIKEVIKVFITGDILLEQISDNLLPLILKWNFSSSNIGWVLASHIAPSY